VLPEIAVRIAPGQRRRLGPDHAHVAQLQSSHQGFAMGLALRKQLAGVEGDYRRRGIDTRHHMEQHGALGTERGDQRDPASERAVLEHAAQQRHTVEPAIGLAQPLEALQHVQRGLFPMTPDPEAGRRADSSINGAQGHSLPLLDG